MGAVTTVQVLFVISGTAEYLKVVEELDSFYMFDTTPAGQDSSMDAWEAVKERLLGWAKLKGGDKEN
jgi:hypothetical protein